MADMIALVASWFPDRKFMLVIDSLYSGKSVLSKLSKNFDRIGPVHSKAALYAPRWEDKLSKVSLSTTPNEDSARLHIFLATLAG